MHHTADTRDKRLEASEKSLNAGHIGDKEADRDYVPLTHLFGPF